MEEEATPCTIPTLRGSFSGMGRSHVGTEAEDEEM